MRLEDQVCSLEISEMFEELGVEQDSLWYWEIRIFQLEPMKGDKNIQLVERDYEQKHSWKHYKYKYYSAFTVAELGEILPDYLSTHKLRDNLWECAENSYSYEELETNMMPIEAKTEADARAKMLIYLIKEGIIKANKE